MVIAIYLCYLDSLMWEVFMPGQYDNARNKTKDKLSALCKLAPLFHSLDAFESGNRLLNEDVRQIDLAETWSIHLLKVRNWRSSQR